MTARIVGRPSHNDRPRLLLISSAGGHLAQMRALQPIFSSHECTWVSFAMPDAEETLADEDVVWAHFPTTRSVRNLVRNLGLAWRTLRSVRPQVVLSCGAGVAVPFFWLAWLMRIATVYVEVFDRVDSISLSARLCRPFATLMLVQWPEQQDLLPEAMLIGPLL